jgi:flagellar basal body-associated protein FliL
LKKAKIFLILLFSSIFLLVVLLIAGFLLTPPVSTPNQSGWVDNMWSCVGDWMSGNYPNSDPILNTWGTLLIIAVTIAILGIGGVTYFFLFPEIRTTTHASKTVNYQTPQNSSAYESVLKTLNEDERNVLNVLKKHDGKYLQKYIRHEAKLSRLKTHRVLARFAERGIVTLQKTGNTNEVTLTEWLK